MPDDLDNQIRAAMKVLDEQTPSGYFEAVPNQILARLEDGSMQHGSTTDIRDKRDALMGPPVVADAADTNPTPKTERDEDSGLHDIRNLAQSTKQRMSRQRITNNPPINDDVLASSSGSFANIALPQPARMVSLPDLEDLPSKQEVIAAQKVAEKARKARGDKPATTQPPIRNSDVLAPNATANAALASLTAAPVEVAPARQAFTLPSMERKKSKGPLIAILGMGVAAAAGGFLYMNMNKAEKSSAAPAAQAAADTTVVAAKAPDPTPAPAAAAGSAAPVEAAPPVEPPKADEAATGTAAAVVADEEEKTSKHAAKHGKAKKGTVEEKAEPKVVEQKVEKPEPTKADPKDSKDKKAGGGEGEPSFDALLKEAGVDDKKKEEKPKLDKKSLSGDDFKKGMSAIQTKAQGCYKGTQGTASVKLTVGPAGQVTKATVGGQFAGTPEGSCIEGAVKGATFPPWDGGPQSFNYSYMLSD